MKNCPYCNSALNDNDVQCPICGYVHQQQYYQPQSYQQYPQNQQTQFHNTQAVYQQQYPQIQQPIQQTTVYPSNYIISANQNNSVSNTIPKVKEKHKFSKILLYILIAILDILFVFDFVSDSDWATKIHEENVINTESTQTTQTTYTTHTTQATTTYSEYTQPSNSVESSEPEVREINTLEDFIQWYNDAIEKYCENNYFESSEYDKFNISQTEFISDTAGYTGLDYILLYYDADLYYMSPLDDRVMILVDMDRDRVTEICIMTEVLEIPEYNYPTPTTEELTNLAKNNSISSLYELFCLMAFSDEALMYENMLLEAETGELRLANISNVVIDFDQINSSYYRRVSIRLPY